MRPWHILKKNARSETAHNLIFFDTETKPERLPDGSERDWLWFGWMCVIQRNSKGAWGRPRWYRFKTVSEFWRKIATVTRAKSRWFLFCHNTSYDLPVLDIFGVPVKRGWKVEGAVIEAPPTIITLKRDSVTLVLLDTLNWWRMPLKTLGEKVKLAKLKMPRADQSPARWDAYCRRDVKVMVRMVLTWMDFLKSNDLGGFAPTLAAQCFRTFRHRFMSHEIIIDADERSHVLSREAYHGGRVECFKLGRQEGPITGVDINSMYPSVMAENDYPHKLLGTYESQDQGRWGRLVKDFCIVARCVVHADAPCYPAMIDGRLNFPLGEFATTLCTPEIVLAMERGELLSMTDMSVYEKAPIFSAYVNFMWTRRLQAQDEGDAVSDWLFKHLGTNLYGKFGQTGMVYETSDHIEDKRCFKTDIYDADKGKWMKLRALGGLLQVMSREGESSHSFPAIAAHVTAYGRVLLWRYIERAGIRNLLYTDTDSLYLTAAGARRLKTDIDPRALGKLKTLGTWDYMHIHGLKDYELPTEIKRKGVRKDAEQLNANTFRQTQWSSLKGLVGLGDVTAPRRKKITKVLSRTYHKKINPT